MYKDKDKQKEAQRNWVRQKRIDKKGSTKQGSTEGVTARPKRSYIVPDGTMPKTKPGDVFEKTRFNAGEISPCSEMRDMKDVSAKPKRGKDIKTFADLPPEVRRIIEVMSTTDGVIDKTIKANRTAIAINYQHLFPDRYHSVGVS